MLSFITGSRAYGKPTDKSDIDLVVRMTLEDKDQFLALCDPKPEMGPGIRFGKLNLIICVTDEEWAIWRLGTTEMHQSALLDSVPYDRDEAKTIFDIYRERVGIGANYG